MEHRALIDVLRQEGEAFAAVEPADLDVPTCPGWTLVDLYHHLGGVHRFQRAQIDPADATELQPRPELSPPEESDDLVDWLLEGLDDLAGRLNEVGPDHTTATWFGPRPARFWARRAAHETAIHRWDAEAAVTTPVPLSPPCALDALDEMLEVIAPRRLARRPWDGDAATIHLHATDADGEWMLRVASSGLEVERTHGKGDVAVRGTASDLTLLAFGRLPLARLEVFGDATVVHRWHAAVNL